MRIMYGMVKKIDFLTAICDDMKAKGIKLSEEGDEVAYLLDDALVMLSLEEGKLEIKILAGTPERLHIKTNLIED